MDVEREWCVQKIICHLELIRQHSNRMQAKIIPRYLKGPLTLMEFLLIFIEAWIIGITIGAIFGPISMLFVRKTLEIGVMGAVAVGLGVATADGVYGIIAALGVSAISQFLMEKEFFVKVLGGLFLLYLAYDDLISKPPAKGAVVKSKRSIRLGIEVFFITLANPLTIASFIGIFSSISNGPVSVLQALIMALGVFLGSITWWLFFGSVLLKIKHKLPDIWLHRIKYISALILGLFGIAAIIGGIIALLDF